MKTVNAVLLSALLMIVGFASMQSVSASPGASLSISPSVSASGTTFLFDVTFTVETNDFYGPRTFVLYDPDEDSTLPLTSFPGCLSYGVEEASDRLWDAEDSSVPPDNLGIFWAGGTVGDVNDIDFGNGDPLTSGTFGTTGAVVLYDPEDGGTGNSPDGALDWNEQPGGAADDTLGLGLYVLVFCNFEDVNTSGPDFTSADTPGIVSRTFRVSMPVGGEILPIDTTALFVAGISYNPVWTLSALGVAAGVAFAILRVQVTRKNF